jgi:tetratricopeptide repeat protein 30
MQSLTNQVYTLIRDGAYVDAVKVLNLELQSFPRSRAALSLLAYCYYHMNDFVRAVSTYEQLVKVREEELF